jgi:hypothetical protein
MDAISLNYDLDHIETLHRKKGILYARKAYRRKRDLLLSLLNYLNRSVILITVGRHLTTVENLEHECLKAVIRVKGNEVNGLQSWSEDLETFRYVSSSLEKSILLANELAERGDVVLFSPYGTSEEVSDWYSLYSKHLIKILV